ncbi:MAG: radical SAM protein [Desulfobulbus oligotrophicus]|jgi:histone acetyltransferase (RNA polymerase elongator complex component)|nr:radical SAM protein [Desulfobulbus oligotrophicus]
MPLIIPIFIPHEGCPHRCLFCNQYTISSRNREQVTGAAVVATIHSWLALAQPKHRNQVQVAFYGGSFTGLTAARQVELLAVVQPFLRRGVVQSIRLSTRPDYIDDEGLAILRRYGVTTVELGVQSCDDLVLQLAGRGHTCADSVRAGRLVKEQGFRLGWQLMPGLPGENTRSLRCTVNRTVDVRPDFVRIYPTLVLRDSGLARQYQQGTYRPLSLNQAVAAVSRMKKRFDDQGIGVVRMGLQSSADLERSLIAGPWHPAFGELVKARLMLQQTRRLLARTASASPVELVINNRDQSIFHGPRSLNLRRLQELGLSTRFTLRLDPQQPRQTVRVVEGAEQH